jgi:hypothetical protein
VPPDRNVAAIFRFPARLKRAAAFVAIVWGVAGSYLAFEVATMRAMNVVLAYPDIIGGLVLSRSVSESTTCVAGPVQGSSARNPLAARADSFALGVTVGHEAVFRQWARSNPQIIAPLTADVQKGAAALGVAAPGRFRPQQLADANREFVAWIEADDQGTARELASRYAPQACHAYKLGAVWGYSEVVRLALPDHRAAFGVEIRHYAQQIPVPAELWRPMLQPSSFPAGSAELEREMAATSARLVAFLNEGSRSP